MKDETVCKKKIKIMIKGVQKVMINII